MKRLTAVLLPLLAALPLMAQNAIRVDVPNLVASGEQFNVTFIIEGEEAPADFQWNPGSDFQLVWGPQRGSSTSVTIVNGKRSRSSQTTYTYVLMSGKEGKFQLPKATARLGGDEISSSAVTVEVVADGSRQNDQSDAGSQEGAQGQSQATGNISDSDLFLKLTLNRTTAVVGEPITATLKLYQRVSIAGFEDARFPTFEGFWSQELQAPSSIDFTRENYNGSLYNSAVLRSWTLIPQRSGSLTIDPAELVCLVNVRVQSGMGSIFDSFFGDDYRTIRKRITSQSHTVKVTALPAGEPASFGGGVGSFTMKAQLSADRLKTHDASSLKITVSGSGNVSLLEAPEVSFPPDFEVYDVKTSDAQGARIFEYPFIPRSSGDFVIDPVEYSYYDIDSRKYVTLKSDPMPIYVEKGSASDSPSAGTLSVAARKDVKDLDSDIRFIVSKAPSFKSSSDSFAFSTLFWLIAGALLAMAAAAYAALRRSSARRADVAGTKNRKATSLARRKLAQAGEFLQKNLYTAYYEELHKALMGFAADKLNMDLADMTKDNISDALGRGGVPEETAKLFVSLLDACEYARYSPDPGHDAMDAHFRSAMDVISEIDDAMKNKKKGSGKGLAAVAALLLLVPAGASAALQDYPDSLWNAGVNAYTEGRWDDALDAWNGIDALGVQSAQLYYNIGNAYFKAEDYARAILYYERALKLDPSSADIRHNLQYANEFIQDNIEAVPEFFLAEWTAKLVGMLSKDAWAVLSLVFLALALALSLLFLLGGNARRRKTGFYAGVAALLLTVLCISFARVQWRQWQDAGTAIVTRAVVSVKSSPGSDSAKDLFILHEGAKVRIIDSVGDWYNIELPDRRQGWLPSSDMEII